MKTLQNYTIDSEVLNGIKGGKPLLWLHYPTATPHVRPSSLDHCYSKVSSYGLTMDPHCVALQWVDIDSAISNRLWLQRQHNEMCKVVRNHLQSITICSIRHVQRRLIWAGGRGWRTFIVLRREEICYHLTTYSHLNYLHPSRNPKISFIVRLLLKYSPIHIFRLGGGGCNPDFHISYQFKYSRLKCCIQHIHHLNCYTINFLLTHQFNFPRSTNGFLRFCF